MTFEESQNYITKRGFYVPWNDCDVFVDEREITRTIGNVLKWADATIVERFRELKSDYEKDLDAEPRVYERDVQLCAKISLIDKIILELEEK
jgi:hypothetical protein